jgi:hypothetical protein
MYMARDSERVFWQVSDIAVNRHKTEINDAFRGARNGR